jgi:intracellular septation protein
VKELIHSGRALLADFASTLFFLALYALTGSIVISVTAGMALALGQIGWHLARKQPVDALQWISLVTVMAAGAATLFTHNPVFVMLKPSVIYVLVGWAMLKRGWMLRYLPTIAMETVPDMAVRFGYIWAGLMFFSAALNLVLALSLGVVAWGTAMTVWATGSKIALFVFQYALMKTIGRRRYRTRNSGHPLLAA